MSWRRKNYSFHTLGGLILSGFLVMVGLSGAILVFDPEIDALAHPSNVEESQNLTKMSPSVVEGIIREQYPEASLKGIFLPTSDDSRFRVELESAADGASTVFVESETGSIIGQAKHPWREAILNLHHSLWLGDWGMAAMFLVACGLTLLAFTGLLVHRKSWKSLTHLPRFSSSARLGFSDLHKMLGVPLFVFLLVMGVTGAWMNTDAFENFANGDPESPAIAEKEEPYVRSEISIEKAFHLARQNVEGFAPGYFRFSKEGKNSLRVSGTVPGEDFYGPYSSRVEIDAKTGEVLKIRDLRSESWPSKSKYLVETLHYADYGGFWLKLLYCISSLGLVAVCITGLLIWRKRRKK